MDALDSPDHQVCVPPYTHAFKTTHIDASRFLISSFNCATGPKGDAGIPGGPGSPGGPGPKGAMGEMGIPGGFEHHASLCQVFVIQLVIH